MNWERFLILALIVIVLGAGIYSLITRRIALEKQMNELSANLVDLQKENNELKDRIEYFSYPENLLKELKSKFNYKQTGEKLMIIVPNTTSSGR